MTCPVKCGMKLLIPCPNVYGCIVEVWDEFINEFILHFVMNIITNPCWDWIRSKLEKEALGHAWSLQYTHISMEVSLAVEEVIIHPNASCCSRSVGETGVHPRLLSTMRYFRENFNRYSLYRIKNEVSHQKVINHLNSINMPYIYVDP